MDFLYLVKKRHSVRNYLTDEIEKEKLEYIFECARHAPSAANFQPWHFYIASSEEAKKAVFESYPRRWMENAPLYIVACGNIDKSWKRGYDRKDYVDVDIAIAFEHICLAAEEQGLGTCWIAHFDPAIIIENLELPSNMVPIAITPLGYPGEEMGERTQRKNAEDIIEFL